MTYYDNYTVRALQIKQAFVRTALFTDYQKEGRDLIFGLYSGAYINGMAYLQAIDAFELALLLDLYNSEMAKLTAEEQRLLIDLAARRYIARIDQEIFGYEMDTERAKLAADSAMWTAKIAALEVDREALVTLQTKLSAKRRTIDARIKSLQAETTQENVNTELTLAEASQKQLDITKAELRSAGKDVDIARKTTEIAETENRLAQKELDLSAADIAITDKQLAVSKLQLQKAEEDLRVVITGLEAAEIQLQITEYALKSLETDRDAARMQIQTAEYTRDIAKTAHLEVDVANANIQKSEEELSLADQDIRLAETEADIAKINAQKKEVELKYIRTNKEIADTELATARTRAQIAETEELEARKDLAQAQYDAEEDKLALYDAKVTVIESKEASALAETTGEALKQTAEQNVHNQAVDAEQARHQHDLDQVDVGLRKSLLQHSESLAAAQNEYDTTEIENDYKDEITDKSIEHVLAAEEATEDKYEIQLDNLETIMEADILTTLRHSIGTD